jgi:hypothetical protein
MGSFLRIGLGSFCYFEGRDFFRLWRLRSAFRLELPQLRGAAMQNAVRLSAGAINGELDFFDGFADGFHGVANDVIAGEQRAELCFDAGAAAEAPGGAVDFVDQEFFENVRGSEAVMEFGAEFGVVALFAGADEAAGEEGVWGSGHTCFPSLSG